MRFIGAAQELLPYGSDREDRQLWLETRRRGITASEISIILGLSKWNSPLSLFFTKLGHLDENEGSYRMDLGAYLEPYVLAQFTKMTDAELEHAGLLASTEREWQMATPDGLWNLAPIEAKTSVSEDDWGPTGSDQVPVYYRCQLLWQMDVIGSQVGYICVVFMRSGEPRWYCLDWDGDDIAIMREAALEFIDRLERGIPPKADGSDASYRALKQLYPPEEDVTAACGRRMVIQYAASLRRMRNAKDRHQLITNKMRQHMGPASRLVDPDGDTVATRRGPKDSLYPSRKLTREDE